MKIFLHALVAMASLGFSSCKPKGIPINPTPTPLPAPAAAAATPRQTSPIGEADTTNTTVLSDLDSQRMTAPAPSLEQLNRILYVSPNGRAKDDGLTPETALPVYKAQEVSQPGDIIYFTEGEYLTKGGKALLTITRSGEPGKPIVYSPAPSAKVVIRSIDAWDAIKVSGAEHIIIQGFRVIGNARNITMEEAMAEMNNLKNPRTCGNGIGITSARETGKPSAHIIVRNCEVSDFPGGGIFANHVDYLTFENNVVYRCALWSPFGNSGLSVYQPTAIDDSKEYKIFIINNVCFENYQNIPFFFSNRNDPSKRRVTDGNGIIIDDFLNTQDWGGGSGKEYTGRTLVINNVTFANGGSGIHSFKSCNVDFVQNYAGDNNRHPDLNDGQIFANTTKNVRILNNVLVAPPRKPVNTSFKNEDIIIDYNVYANLDGSLPKFQGDKANNILAAPSMELVGWEKGKRTVNVTANSPLREAGLFLEYNKPDFFGKMRSEGKPDVGPFVIAEPSVTIVPAAAQPTFTLPSISPNGELKEAITLTARGHGPVKDSTQVSATDGPTGDSTAIQVIIPNGTEGKKFRVNAKGEIAGAISSEKPVILTFMARSPEGNRMLALVHNGANPDRVKLMTDIKLTPDWKSYKIIGDKPQSFAAGEAFVDFMMGENPGTIEISAVVVYQ